MNGPQALHRPDSAEVTIRRTETPDNGAGLVANDVPPVLHGIKVPTHNRTVYRRVIDAYLRDERDADLIGVRRLTVEALPLVVALFDNVQRRRKLAKALDAQERKHGVLTTEGKARQALDKLLDLDGTILRQMDALGWTPTSMARFGVDLARLGSSSQGREPVPPVSESDLRQMEERILARLHDRPAEDGDRPALAAEATPTGAGDETSSDAARDARERDE